jgi:hypothetical protein
VTAHEHDVPFSGQRNFQVRGDLLERDGELVLDPHRVLGGFELPPGKPIQRLRLNAAKVRRYRQTAKRELASRGR